MRPKSADINGRVSGQKRNSGLLRVDLPTIPDGECATSFSEQPPTSVNHQLPFVAPNGVYARGSGSQTPTSQYSGDGQQLVFEQSDMMTGTIKRQPLEHSRQSNSLLPLHQRRQSAEGAGSVSSGKVGSLRLASALPIIDWCFLIGVGRRRFGLGRRAVPSATPADRRRSCYYRS